MSETEPAETDQTFVHRNPEDIVGEFERFEIDRDSGTMSGDFLTSDGSPLLQSVVDEARAKGRYSVLDAGCGTGRTLWDLKEQVNQRANVAVRAVGINAVNYSQESGDATLCRAIDEQEIDYRVEDLEYTHFDDPEFDLIVCYEVLIHNKNFDKIALTLFDGLNSGGRMYLNLLKEQIDSPEWEAARTTLSEEAEVREFGSKRGEKMRFFAEVTKF